MKLYLSSYGLGNHPEELQKLVGDNKLAGVILNAQDLADTQKRQDKLDIANDEMASLGFEPKEIDLRQYFNKQNELEIQLAKLGLLWIRGGNVFVLQRAMKMSGFDKKIHSFLTNDQLVYAGFSAGSCAAGPSLHGAELCDDNTTVPEGYAGEVVWDGLGLIPYSIVPHYRSDHPIFADIENVVNYFIKHDVAYKTLRDGQAIVINGQSEVITA